MKCEKTESIWLEDELNDNERNYLKEHIKNCNVCSREYENKKAFKNIVDDFKERSNQFDLRYIEFKPKKKTLRTAKLIPLVAALSIIFVMSSIAYSTGAIHDLINFTTKNFGWNYGVIQDGQSYVQDNLIINISPIAVSKSDITFAILIENLKDDKLIYSAEDIWIEADGKIYKPNGFVGASFEKKMGYGELNFNFNDGLTENIMLKIRNFNVQKTNKYDVGKIIKKIEGEFEYPIVLREEIIDKANKNVLVYPIDKNIEISNLSIDFLMLEVESSRSVIRHNVKGDNFINFGHIKILDDNNNVISERRYNNGTYEYTNEDGIKSAAMMNENRPYETALLPFVKSKPAKIEINSYIEKKKYGSIILDDYIKELNPNNAFEGNEYFEQQINFSDITLNMRLYNDSDIVEIFCNTPKLLEFTLKSSKDTLNAIESTATVNLDESNQVDLDYYIKYEVNANENLILDLIETKETPINIEFKIFE